MKYGSAAFTNSLSRHAEENEIVVAVDTEYQGVQTLTAQAACRLDQDTLAIQVYTSPAVPGLPDGFDPEKYLPTQGYGRFFRNVVLRPARPLSPDLSPMTLLRDLLGLEEMDILTRPEGQGLVDAFGPPGEMPAAFIPANVQPSRKGNRWEVPSILVTLVGHFLTTDFFRVMGRDYLRDLLAPGGGIVPACRKLVKLEDEKRRFGDPVVGYARGPNSLFEVRLRTRDTILPFGHASLESHSRSFLRLGKNDAVAEDEKGNMMKTFHTRTADAYGYAVADAVNTLLVHEQMVEKDRQVYAGFGFGGKEVPPLRPTLGSRVSTFLVQATLRQAAGSESLGSQRSLEELMARGGHGLFATEQASRFGEQTGHVQGGLLYSRSPTRFWHEAEGQMRDVDMAGCYQSIIQGMSVRWGRPVVYEPGGEPFALADAVALASKEADPDAWFVRVTGRIESHPNALIPSTDGAVTASAFQRGRKARRRARLKAARIEDRRDPGAAKGNRGSRLYSAIVESGVVTLATWRMIQALPSNLRHEYENLSVDSLVFYPRSLSAGDGEGFDRLVARHGTDGLPWRSTLDMEGLELAHRERIDADYVTLKLPVGDYARRIGELRREAQRTEGRKSGMDLAWKLHANTMYGVLCSRHLPTSNVVAANVVTAHARAVAFAVGQALNCIQTITDGCTYRRDQFPAATFAECLKIRPDFTVRRVEAGDGIPFLDPSAIPEGDEAFTAWLRGHLRRFFEVEGEGWDDVFGVHGFEHKKTGKPESPAFDALGVDGAGTWIKCKRDEDGNWKVEDFAARSFGKEAKAVLAPWLVDAYSSDRLKGPAPLADDRDLLSFHRAGQKARRLLSMGVPEVVFPLRLELGKIANYRVVKPSMFVFMDPAQRAAWLKAIHKFEARTGAGLELLSLRRSYGGRRNGSLSALAEELHALVMAGEPNPSKTLNLARRARSAEAASGRRLEEIRSRRRAAERDLEREMDTRRHGVPLATGYFVDAGAMGVEVRQGRLAGGGVEAATAA